MKKTAAVCCLGALLLFLAVLGRRETELLPANVRTGDPVAPPLTALAPPRLDSTVQTIDVVLVARDCGACRTLVSQLVRTGGTPPPQHRAVFLTDQVWPDLVALRGERTTIVAGDSLVPRSIGLRATPTVVAYDVHSARVSLVAVGVRAVADRFSAAAHP